MIRSAVQHLRVQIRACMVRESAKKILQQLSLQAANPHHVYLMIKRERRTPTKIDRLVVEPS